MTPEMQEGPEYEYVIDEDDDYVYCNLCGVPWDLCGNGEGVVLESRHPEMTPLGEMPRQIKLCFDCASQAAFAFEQLCRARDQCEHGVICGEWCEPCNKAYKEARIAAGEEG